MAKPIEIINWGLIDYDKAFSQQAALVDQIIAGTTSEKIIFCSHPPIVTLGRGTKPGDVFAWNGPTVEVNRGGRATYHGPSQLIMYPLIYIGDSNEAFISKKIKPKDLHHYMRVLEESVVDVLTSFGVTSQGKTLQLQVGEELAEEATGVWVNDKKIASVGIAIRKWVTSHGVALNISYDPKAFIGMNPCGFRSDQMTDLETLTQKQLNTSDILQTWQQAFLSRLV